MSYFSSDLSSLSAPKEGELRVLTGFSAAGKTFFASSMEKASPSLRHLVEDSFYTRPEVLHRAFRFTIEAHPFLERSDPLRTFYLAGQETLFDRALFEAKAGRAVLVDVCCGQPDDFFALLKKHHALAQKQGVPFSVDWVSCDPAVRQARLLQGRATAFDLVLAAAEDYLPMISRIEEDAKLLGADSFPVRFWINNHGGTSPPPSETALAGSDVKNIPVLSAWAANEHLRLLRLYSGFAAR